MTDQPPWHNIRSAVQRPADFDDFWHGMLTELARVPLDWERFPDPSGDRAVDWLRFTSIDGITIYGWLAAADVARHTQLAGYLWLPGYSLGNPPPGPESLYPGALTFGLNVHGNPPDTPYVHPSTEGRDYITNGIESPRDYIIVKMVCHCLRALEVLAAQPEVDPDRLMVGGMSQGGGLALVAAALSPRVIACLADMPWLCDIDRALSLIDRSRYNKTGRVAPDRRLMVLEYAEAHPELHDQIFETYRYIDPLSHAANIRCATQMSAGGRDPSCRAATIFSVYNDITALKEMLYLPERGHEIVPEMRIAHGNWVYKWLQT